MLDRKTIRIECPNCKEVVLPIKRPKTICANCGKNYKWHELQRKWQEVFISINNGSETNSDEVFESCVKCTRQSMIFYNKLNILGVF